MTFLFPSFLWALAALSIPIIIHLFNFRRTKRVFFSNNRFLKQVKEVTTAKRRLKHYLILASRLLFLLFLVLAFAQPFIPAKEQLGTNRTVQLYIDNSQSMSARLPDQTTGLETALSFTNSLVDVLPADTRYNILTNDFAPFSNTSKTKVEVQDILAQIRLTPVSRSMSEIQERIKQNSQGSRDVFWVSDFQKSTLGSITGVGDSSSRFHLVPLEFDELSNVFVDTAFLENPFAASGEKNQLRVKLRNDGTSAENQLNVKLSINGIQAGTAVVDIPAKGSAETLFDLSSGLQGLNRGYITFNDAPVSFDNEFYFALNFTDKIRILEIKQGSGVSPVQRVYGNREIFNFSSYSVDNFNYSLLNEAELVVLNGLNRIEAPLAMSLANFLSQQNGTLLFIPGPQPDVKSYQQVTAIATFRTATQTTPLSELDKPDFANPFFENVFEERSVSMAMPSARKIIDWGSDRTAILSFKNGQPFLTQITSGGKLFLLASPLAEGFTDFYNHALFVPVMYKIAATGQKRQNKLYYTLNDDFIRLQLDSVKGEQPLKMVGEREIVPAQRSVNREHFIEIPKFSIDQGFYHIVDEADTLTLTAFNPEKAESLLDQYTGNEMKNQMGNGSNISIFEAGSAAAFSDELKARYLGKPLWKYALMLSLLFLLAEVLLIRFLK